MNKIAQTSNAKKGGLFTGKSHAQGGIPAIVTDTGQPIEVEGGEAIITKKATAMFCEQLSEINQAGGGVPIPCPSDVDKIMDKFDKGGLITQKEKKQVYDKWKSLVNMTYTELKNYYNSKDGKSSGLSKSEANEQGISSGRESAEWIMKMKRLNWKEWNSQMWKWAKKQISFISRMRGVEGAYFDDNNKRTPKLKSLLIWGHNPAKYSGGGGVESFQQTGSTNKHKEMKVEQKNGFQYFYDSNIRLWTAYPIDSFGNRIEFDKNDNPIEAEYFNNKSQLNGFLEKKHPIEKMAKGKLIDTNMEKPEFSKEALKIVPKHQLKLLKSIDFSEQEDATANVNEAVALVPKIYGQDGVKDKMIYLHYFYGNQDWYITEYDKGSEWSPNGEFFGYVNIGYGFEIGYISVEELVNNGKIELDFYFKPTLWSEVDPENESAYDKQNTSQLDDEETDIDFTFQPVNENANSLMKALIEMGYSVKPTDVNVAEISKTFADIDFKFEAFDNYSEFKFSIIEPKDKKEAISYLTLNQLYYGLSPAYTTSGGTLLPMQEIANNINTELTDFMTNYLVYKNKTTESNKELNETKSGKIPVKLIGFQIASKEKTPSYSFDDYDSANKKMRELLDTESFSDLEYFIEWQDGKLYEGVIDCEPRSFFKGKKQPFTDHINYFFKKVAEYDGDALINPADQYFFQTLIKNYQLLPESENSKALPTVLPTVLPTSLDVNSYKNPYELNKAIEKWIDENVGSFENVMSRTYSTEEKMFIRNYTGYGGLGKYGELTVGSMFEFFTPQKVIKTMWALAYKYGYSVEKSILETSVGTGEFLQFASPQTRKVAYEINRYSATITKILYPTTEVRLAPFESLFIKDNFTIKGKTDKLEKFDMVIGNCPYGSFDVLDDKASRYLLGMGEKDFTKANNYIEYFLRRSLDCLKPNGFIVMIVGAELKNGGKMFLDSGESPVKEYLNENSILLDAYRLPDSTFERTGVTSDILVIQKK